MYKLLGSIRDSWSLICERLYQYALLIRLNRPIGVFLLLWPTLWALWIAAEGFPNINVFIVFILGVFIMRSAGCALNDIADKRFDTFVIRTRTRPLAAEKITSIEALIIAISLIFIALLLVLTMNELTIQLSLFAVILAGVYPFMKRYTYLPQFFLGLAFGWSIPMAFAAQTNTVPKIAWLLLVTNILWSVVYDTIYAMIDREEDLKIGVKSTAILFDDADRVIIAIIQALVLLALIAIGRQLKLDYNYFISLLVVACLFLYQLRLIWNREPQQCMRAFINNNWVGLIIFIGIFLSYF